MDLKSEMVCTTEPGNTQAFTVRITRQQAANLVLEGKITNQGYGVYATRLSKDKLIELTDGEVK